MTYNQSGRVFQGFTLCVVLVLLLAGCGDTEQGESAESVPVQSDVEGLREWIEVPGEPEAVQWVRYRFDQNPLLSQPYYRLMATLRYDEAGMEIVRGGVGAPSPLKPSQVWKASWFPADLLAQMEAMEAAGDPVENYIGFIFNKSLYTCGAIYLIEPYVVLVCDDKNL